ncbi:hypothetical protein D9M71_155000 [compost metagenome]
MFRGSVVPSIASMRDADLDQNMAGRSKAANLPTIDRHVISQVVATQRHPPEWWRHNVFHMTRRDYLITMDRGDWRYFVDFLLADARGMNIRLMGEVHKIVDHKAVIAGDVE